MTRHTLSIATSLVTCVLALTACKTPTPNTSEEGTSTGGVEAASGEVVATRDVLVFIPGVPVAQKDTPGETVWYTLSDTALTEVARTPGRVVASRDGSMWRYAARVTDVEMSPCQMGLEDEAQLQALQSGEVVEPTLTPLGGGDVGVIVPAFADGADPTKETFFELNIGEVYQLGDNLFINVGTYFECGAHPSYSLNPVVVSLVDGSVSKLDAFVSGLDGLDDERAAAFAAMDPELVMGEESETAPTIFSVELVDGAPTLRVQMTAGTAYVTKDGSWDSYSMSETIDVKGGAPAPLAPALDVPAPLLEMFVKRGSYLDHSVFELPAKARAERLAAFTSGE